MVYSFHLICDAPVLLTIVYSTSENLVRELLEVAPQPRPPVLFFKTGPGAYAEHDQFLGLAVPVIRKIIQPFLDMRLSELVCLLESPFNEVRLAALLILLDQYQRSRHFDKGLRYAFYLENRRWINNWNLVDASAPGIIGAHLLHTPSDILMTLAQSLSLWDRRIAIVATLALIQAQQFDWTLRIAHLLQNDHEDLIHKATGWMLREVGKKDMPTLLHFLDHHAATMPRTMLRYAIEKLSPQQRQSYLKVKTLRLSKTSPA